MSISRAEFREIVGLTAPIVGEIVVSRARGNELVAVDGTRYTAPQLEERLIITIERAGPLGTRGIAADGRSQD